jgi:hypothetical protein
LEENRAQNVLEVDSRRRISLGSLAEHDRYLVDVDEDGTIVLTPAVVMSAAQARLLAAAGTSRRIDEFLDHPETGSRRIRPARKQRRSPSSEAVSREWMRGAVELLFSPEAGDVLDELEKDDSNARLIDAVWDALDLICEHPGSAQARHRGLRTVGGHSVWLVPMHGLYDDQVWVVLWQSRGDDALIAYIGPEDFRPDRS